MMRSLRRLGIASLGLCAVAAAAPTQTDTSQRSTPTYTLEDVLTSLRKAADTLDLARTNPAQSQALDSISAMLRAARAWSQADLAERLERRT